MLISLGAPTDIAHAMLFLASEQAAYITGQTITVDGGSTLPESPVLMEQFYRSKVSQLDGSLSQENIKT